MAVTQLVGSMLAQFCFGVITERLATRVRDKSFECLLRQDVAYFDDSKATNVGAALAAINGFAADMDGKLVLIAGGDGKGADFAPLQAPVAAHCRAVVLLGRDADRLSAALGDAVVQRRVGSIEDAVTVAAELAEAGDLVLLSPACASFDQFTSYESRGAVFRDLVEALL